MGEAKNIGLLFTVNDEQTYNRIDRYAKLLQRDRKVVRVLGFVNEKSIPHYCQTQIFFDYFTLKDLNWYNKPVKNTVNDFISKEFDVLIDLNTTDDFFIQHIAGVSKAHFKVGKYAEMNTRYYDLMIQLQGSTDQDSYIEQIHHYLTIINNNNNVQEI